MSPCLRHRIARVSEAQFSEAQFFKAQFFKALFFKAQFFKAQSIGRGHWPVDAGFAGVLPRNEGPHCHIAGNDSIDGAGDHRVHHRREHRRRAEGC